MGKDERKITKIEGWFYRQINEVDASLSRLKKRKKKSQRPQVLSKTSDITTDLTDTKSLQRTQRTQLHQQNENSGGAGEVAQQVKAYAALLSPHTHIGQLTDTCNSKGPDTFFWPLLVPAVMCTDTYIHIHNIKNRSLKKMEK